MHKLILDNLLLINHSNMFRPLSRSHHQGVRNPWALQSHCIDLLECCYVYVFASRYDSCGMLSILARLWIGAAISNTSHSNKSGSTTVKRARLTGKGSRSTAVLP